MARLFVGVFNDKRGVGELLSSHVYRVRHAHTGPHISMLHIWSLLIKRYLRISIAFVRSTPHINATYPYPFHMQLLSRTRAYVFYAKSTSKTPYLMRSPPLQMQEDLLAYKLCPVRMETLILVCEGFYAKSSLLTFILGLSLLREVHFLIPCKVFFACELCYPVRVISLASHHLQTQYFRLTGVTWTMNLTNIHLDNYCPVKY